MVRPARDREGRGGPPRDGLVDPRARRRGREPGELIGRAVAATIAARVDPGDVCGAVQLDEGRATAVARPTHGLQGQRAVGWRVHRVPQHVALGGLYHIGAAPEQLPAIIRRGLRLSRRSSVPPPEDSHRFALFVLTGVPGVRCDSARARQDEDRKICTVRAVCVEVEARVHIGGGNPVRDVTDLDVKRRPRRAIAEAMRCRDRVGVVDERRSAIGSFGLAQGIRKDSRIGRGVDDVGSVFLVVPDDDGRAKLVTADPHDNGGDASPHGAESTCAPSKRNPDPSPMRLSQND
eukprot:CAMPEP_0198493454 /NCGR_PEP_ID=MMETSP1462-20131121/4027_1 /TAXON_ID=1333877 /ORGANISM="Brandtodinium nutriculum, Strain RCC3387" /LENGTH=291 /DNA_ID=CAMNT_0044222143 /DNA_START=224 /DNA_END=1096 /DNA_ORIENTATION=-